MDILSIRLFLRIAEIGTVSGAAKDLSLSPASASARLAKLEDVIGIRLFNRTTRAVSLTSDGAEFLPYAQQSLETLEAGLSLNSGQGAQTKGVLRVARFPQKRTGRQVLLRLPKRLKGMGLKLKPF